MRCRARPRYGCMGRDSACGNPSEGPTRNPEQPSTTIMPMLKIIIGDRNCRKDECEYTHPAEQSYSATSACSMDCNSSRPDCKCNGAQQPTTEAQECAHTKDSLRPRFLARQFPKIIGTQRSHV